jgi:hypothetical protein
MLNKIFPAICSFALISVSSMATSATEDQPAEVESNSSEILSEESIDFQEDSLTLPDEVVAESMAVRETPGAAHDEYWAGVLVHFSKPPQWLNAGSHWDFGHARLTLRASDGKLLLTDKRNGRLKWSTPAAGRGAILRFQKDSNLVLYSSAGRAVWSSNTYRVCQNDRPNAGNPILGLQEDSNFVVYCSYAPFLHVPYKAKWATGTVF